MKINNIPVRYKSGLRGHRVGGRRGGMLLIVLIILAVTVILLSSALMVTVSARNRYYVTAEQDQAGLTAMSVAKSINDAIYYGKIKDEHIEKLLLSGPVHITGGAIPGLADTANSNTTVQFSQAAHNGFPDGWIFIDIVTTIDADVKATGSTEKVRLVLERLPDEPAGFQNLMTFFPNNSGMMNIGNAWLGDNAPIGALNLVVSQNKTNGGAGTKAFISDMVYRSIAEASNGIAYEGNVVLWGDDAAIKSGGGGDGFRTEKYILALNKTAPSSVPPVPTAAGCDNSMMKASVFKTGMSPTSSFDNFSGWNGGFQCEGLYLSDTYIGFAGGYYDTNVFTLWQGLVAEGQSQLFWNNKSSVTTNVYLAPTVAMYKDPAANFITLAADNAFVTDIKLEAKKFMDHKDQIDTTRAQGIARAMKDIKKCGLLETSAAVKAAYDDPTHAIKILDATFLGQTSAITLTDSQYIVDVSKNNTNVNRQIKFDMSGTPITLYFYGHQTLNFNVNGAFIFANGGPNFGRIISYDGASISMSPEWWGSLADVNGSPTGIMATNQSFSGPLKLITSTPGGALESFGGGVYGYSYSHKPSIVQKTTNQAIAALYSYTVTKDAASGAESPIPFLFVYMFGSSNINISAGDVLQGYYGLYGANSSLNSNGSPHLYARVEAANFVTSGGQTHVPYCPAPDAGGSDTGSASKYVLYGYENK